MRTPRTFLLACLTSVIAASTLAPAAALAARDQESTFQDDNNLVYATPAAAGHTMDILKGLGVTRLRISVFWRVVAPASDAATKPAFAAENPADYPQGAWDRYDTIVRLAKAKGLGVNFNVTSPAPNWATGTPDRSDIDKTFDPNADEYKLFMVALGRRYSGTYVPAGQTTPLPRVDYWSIWNEPNQAGWLTPQWAKDPRSSNAMVEAAPQIYRRLVDAGWSALQSTGHGKDTILIGETAPKGLKGLTGETRSIDALRFIRQLYCLDDNLQLYQGSSAVLRGCPIGSDAARKFAADHPGLFLSTGWAHHPYELTFSPTTRPPWKDWATIANLGSLSKLLRRAHQRYGQPLGGRHDVPLYLTEFGYQTNPPDPLAVSTKQQAAWINQSEYIAYRNPAVRTLSQFLLVDDKPDPGVPKTSPAAWSTFQSGIVNLDGSHKPSFDAYRFPVFLPKSRATKKGRLSVWGIPRVAGGGKRRTVVVEARRGHKGAFHRVGILKSDRVRGYVSGRVTVHRSGQLRLYWKNNDTGAVYRSRTVPFSVPRR